MPLPVWLRDAQLPDIGSGPSESSGSEDGTSRCSSSCSSHDSWSPKARWRSTGSAPCGARTDSVPAAVPPAQEIVIPRAPRFRCQLSRVDDWLRMKRFNIFPRQNPPVPELTHSRIDMGRLTKAPCGKFAIPDEYMDEFHRQVVRSGDAPYYFHEVATNVFPLFVDVDGAPGGIATVSRCIVAGVQSCYREDADTSAIILGCEASERKPGGLHIHFPGLLVDKTMAWRVREAAIGHIVSEILLTPAGHRSLPEAFDAAEDFNPAGCRAAWQRVWDIPLQPSPDAWGNVGSLYPAGLRMVGSRKCERCSNCRGRFNDCRNCQRGFLDRGRVYHVLLCYESGRAETDEVELRTLQNDRVRLLRRTTVRSTFAEIDPEPLQHVRRIPAPQVSVHSRNRRRRHNSLSAAAYLRTIEVALRRTCPQGEEELRPPRPDLRVGMRVRYVGPRLIERRFGPDDTGPYRWDEFEEFYKDDPQHDAELLWAASYPGPKEEHPGVSQTGEVLEVDGRRALVQWHSRQEWHDFGPAEAFGDKDGTVEPLPTQRAGSSTPGQQTADGAADAAPGPCGAAAEPAPPPRSGSRGPRQRAAGGAAEAAPAPTEAAAEAARAPRSGSRGPGQRAADAEAAPAPPEAARAPRSGSRGPGQRPADSPAGDPPAGAAGAESGQRSGSRGPWYRALGGAPWVV